MKIEGYFAKVARSFALGVTIIFLLSFASADLLQFANVPHPDVVNVGGSSAVIEYYDHPDTSIEYDQFDKDRISLLDDDNINPNPQLFTTYTLLDGHLVDYSYVPEPEVGDSYTFYLAFEDTVGIGTFSQNAIYFSDFVIDNSNGVTDYEYSISVDTDVDGVNDHFETGLVSEIMATPEKTTDYWDQFVFGGLDLNHANYHYGEITFTAIGEPVDNTPPVMSVEDVFVDEGEEVLITFTATDEGGVDVTSWRVDKDEFGITEEGVFHNVSPLVPGEYNVLVSVDDLAGNTAREEVVVTVIDSCVPEIVFTDWSEWSDDGECRDDDTKLQIRSRVEYDANVCGEVEDVTYTETQEVACDFCTPDVVFSDWSEWSDDGECRSDDTKLQTRSKVEYDANVCGEVEDVTYTETQEAVCDFCTPDMINGADADFNSDGVVDDADLNQILSNLGSANPFYDLNSDGIVDGGDIRVVSYNFGGEYVVDGDGWSEWADDGECRANNTRLQVRKKFEHDANFCGEVDDIVTLEYKELDCGFVPIGDEDTLIDECGELDESDTTYVLTDDIDFDDGTCLSIEGDNIVLDCDSYSISNGKNSGVGVYASGENITVENCEINVREGKGMFFEGVKNSIIRNNEISRAAHGIYFIDVDDSKVVGNSIRNSHYHGIYGRGSEDNLILNNSIVRVSGPGIFLQEESHGNTIEFNEITKVIDGISLSVSDDTMIRDNEISKNYGKAARLFLSNGNTIIKNLIYGNNYNDIYVGSKSFGNSIKDNIFEKRVGKKVVSQADMTFDVLGN